MRVDVIRLRVTGTATAELLQRMAHAVQAHGLPNNACGYNYVRDHQDRHQRLPQHPHYLLERGKSDHEEPWGSSTAVGRAAMLDERVSPQRAALYGAGFAGRCLYQAIRKSGT